MRARIRPDKILEANYNQTLLPHITQHRMKEVLPVKPEVDRRDTNDQNET